MEKWMIPGFAFLLAYDDEPEVETEEKEEKQETPPPAKKTKVQFDADQQAYVNSLVAEEKRKVQTKNQQLITQLETQKNLVATTAAERATLDQRIEELKSEFLTKEELGKKESSKKIREIETRAKAAETERDYWKGLFQTDRVTTELTQAAVAHKAYDPEQITTILRNNTRLVEVVGEDGKPIKGKYLTKIRITGKDSDGKPVDLDLTATEAVKQMTEMPEKYGNLFNSGATGGLGGFNTPSKTAKGGPPKTTAEYMAWRDQQKK